MFKKKTLNLLRLEGVLDSEAYLEPIQTSKMELLRK